MNAHKMAWQAGYDCFWAIGGMDHPRGWGDFWYEYEDGFLTAWEEHDNQILRDEKPWLFTGFGCVSREIVMTRDCIIFNEASPLFN